MKRILALLLALIMCVPLCACSTEMNDEGFITNLTAALESRWKISTAGTNSTNSSEYKEYLSKLVDVELSKLGNYSEYTFADENLASLAEQYFAALENQREGIQYYSVDDELYRTLFTVTGYNKRAELIYLLNKDYNFQVNSKYTSTLKDFIALGEKINAIENILTQKLVLEFTGSSSEVLIENTTKYDLSGAQLYFNFYDDAGVLVNTAQTYIQSWSTGSKIRASVYTPDQNFSSAEMNIILFESGIETEYVPIEYVNNMIITIESPELPKELSYGYSDKIYSSVIVNDFDYSYDNYWHEGKINVKLHFAGTKSYDNEGENASNTTVFAYKLCDENNVVVSSGSVYISELTVGESFKEASTYTDSLEVGTYRLFIEDYMN